MQKYMLIHKNMIFPLAWSCRLTVWTTSTSTLSCSPRWLNTSHVRNLLTAWRKATQIPSASSTTSQKKKRYVGGAIQETQTQWCQYYLTRSKKSKLIQNQFIKHVQKFYIITLQEYNFMLHDVSKFCRILILEKTPSSTFNEKKALVGAFSKYCWSEGLTFYYKVILRSHRYIWNETYRLIGWNFIIFYHILLSNWLSPDWCTSINWENYRNIDNIISCTLHWRSLFCNL